MDVSIELVQKIEGINDLSGAVEVMQPILQPRAIIRIAGKAVHDQLHLLFRQILEREFAGGWRHAADAIYRVLRRTDPFRSVGKKLDDELPLDAAPIRRGYA